MVSCIKKSIVIYTFSICLAASLLTSANVSKNTVVPVQKLSTNSSQKYSDNRKEASGTKNKLRIWLGVRQNAKNLTFKEIIKFVYNNPHWPQLNIIKEKAENYIDHSVSPREIVGWFKHNPPLTFQGIQAYARSLKEIGKKHEVKSAIIKAWHAIAFDKNNERKFLSHYGHLLSVSDHKLRLNFLLWNSKVNEADRLIAFLNSKALKVERLTLDLLKGRPPEDSIVLDNAYKDECLLFAFIRWNRINEKYDICAKLLDKMPLHTKHAEIWWGERNYIVRELIAQKRFAEAYALVKNHLLSQGENYANAEWLSGWIALRFMKNPLIAKNHFLALSKKVGSPISKSRAYYWLGRTYEALGNTDQATAHYHQASLFKGTYYGQLSAKKICEPHSFLLRDLFHITSRQKQEFEDLDLVQAIRALAKSNDKEKAYLRTFLCHFSSQENPLHIKELAVKLAYEISKSNIVWTARKAATKNHILLKIAYPQVQVPKNASSNVEKALIMAVIYQESRFDPKEVSSAGAMGYMQMLPRVASYEAKRLGIPYANGKLFNPHYNITLGSHHLESMLSKFNNSPELALAAYNAGEEPVKQWLTQFGDPRSPDVDVIDWVELIPYYETRNYVQRVMETLNIYRSILKDT